MAAPSAAVGDHVDDIEDDDDSEDDDEPAADIVEEGWDDEVMMNWRAAQRDIVR